MRAQNVTATAGRSKIVIKLAHGGASRELALAPGLAYALFAFAPLLVLCGLAIGGYSMFRDDMLASLMRRQARMQFAYEDRIAALRSQIDTIASRQMLDQDSFEGKVAELAVRQARLESRSALVAALAAKVDPSDAAGASAPVAAATASGWSAPTRAGSAAAKPPVAAKPGDKPTPEGFDLRRTQPLDGQRDDVSDNSDPSDPTSPAERLKNLAANFDRLERRQIAALDGLRAPAAAKAERLREAFADAGLPVERMIRHAEAVHPADSGESAAPIGGPFEPVTATGAGAFDRAFAGLNKSVAMMNGLRDALPFAPLRQPLPGPIEMTSPFGYRVDPFFGRPALHTGMDMRGAYGEPIRATAAGRVTIAALTGGYGNMVEIDHGAGLSNSIWPYVGDRRHAGTMGQGGRDHRPDRLDRALDRPAPALRSAGGRRPRRSRPLSQGGTPAERGALKGPASGRRYLLPWRIRSCSQSVFIEPGVSHIFSNASGE